MADRLSQVVATGMLVAMLSAPVAAQVATPQVDAALPDPTRPPATVEAPDADASDAAVRPPVLSSVLIPAGSGRRRAVIDGRSLGMGDAVGDAIIIAITETGVTLKGAQGTRLLPLTPGIEKKMLRSTPDKRQTGVTRP